MKKRRFELINSCEGLVKVGKFWEVWIEDSTLMYCYGKIGTNGHLDCVGYGRPLFTTQDIINAIQGSAPKPGDSWGPSVAKKAMDKLIKQKIKKGYIEV